MRPSAARSSGPVDAVDLGTGELVFSAFPDTILEDIDAFHLLPDDEVVVFSTSTDVTQGFGGIPNIKNGDLVLWDGATATLLFSELVGFGSPTTTSTPSRSCRTETGCCPPISTRPSVACSSRTATSWSTTRTRTWRWLYQGLDEATIFTGMPNSNPDIDALHATPDGTVIFSIRSDGIGRVGTDRPTASPTCRGPISSRSTRRPSTRSCSWKATGSSTASPCLELDPQRL